MAYSGPATIDIQLWLEGGGGNAGSAPDPKTMAHGLVQLAKLVDALTTQVEDLKLRLAESITLTASLRTHAHTGATDALTGMPVNPTALSAQLPDPADYITNIGTL